MNPGAHKPAQKLPNRRTQALLWYLVAGIIALAIVQAYFTTPELRIEYGQFKERVAEGKIKTALISPDRIHGKQLVKSETGGEEEQPYVVTRGGVPADQLIDLLEAHDVKYDGEEPSMLGGVLIAWILPLAIIFAFWIFLMRRMGGGAENVLSLGKSKAKVFAETDIKTTFADVAGVIEAVEEVREVVDYLRESEKFKRLGAQIPKGIVLVGLPGTGKTLLARALAGEAKVPFFHLSGSDFVEMFAGLGAARVRDLFKQAKEKAPCIVFIDELDALGKMRTSGSFSGHEEREQTLNALLVEMDGFEPNAGVVLVAATNRPEILDPALMRPGRFDRQVVVDRPDQEGRHAILKVHAKDKILGDDIDLAKIAQRTVGLVGADLANVLNEAALLAGRRDSGQIDMKDVEEAIDRTMAGLKKKTRILSDKERELVAYHEAGHALLAQTLPGADRVHRVSIVPRGIAALGYTIQLPAEDRYVVRRSELEDRLCVLFGGRAAEELIFGEVSTGAQNDIEVATGFARRMVTEYGMSEKLGLVALHGGSRPRFLDSSGTGQSEHSDETGREIDLEVKRLVSVAYTRALEGLEDQRGGLERIALRLLEVEVLGRDALDRLIAGDLPAESSEQAPETARAEDQDVE